MNKHGFESPIRVEMLDGDVIFVDDRGRDVLDLPGGAERIVACFNALRHVHFPANHVAELERQCVSKEVLRKAAWDEVLQLRARLEELGEVA